MGLRGVIGQKAVGMFMKSKGILQFEIGFKDKMLFVIWENDIDSHETRLTIDGDLKIDIEFVVEGKKSSGQIKCWGATLT